jgi:hypothetical protein
MIIFNGSISVNKPLLYCTLLYKYPTPGGIGGSRGGGSSSPLPPKIIKTLLTVSCFDDIIKPTKGGLYMNTKDAVKQVMKECKTTQAQLAKLLGYSGQPSISERLKSDMQISTLRAMMDAMGYEVVIQKKKQGKRPAGQIVLDGEES